MGLSIWVLTSAVAIMGSDMYGSVAGKVNCRLHDGCNEDEEECVGFGSMVLAIVGAAVAGGGDGVGAVTTMGAGACPVLLLSAVICIASLLSPVEAWSFAMAMLFWNMFTCASTVCGGISIVPGCAPAFANISAKFCALSSSTSLAILFLYCCCSSKDLDICSSASLRCCISCSRCSS